MADKCKDDVFLVLKVVVVIKQTRGNVEEWSKQTQMEHMTLCASNESLALCLSGSKIFMISKESSINSNSLQQLNVIPISQREHMTLCIECITFTLFMLCYFHWDSVYYCYLKSFNLPRRGGRTRF